MARFILLEAAPWRVADGAPEAVRLAGGGGKPYSGLRGFADWRGGVATFPLFVAAAGYSDKGWTGGAIPQTSQIRIFPSDDALRAMLLSKYHWKGAPIEIRSGDDDVPNVYIMECVGIVDNVAASDGAITLTVADLAAKLNVPVVTSKYAGTGGIEGPAEVEGRPKRRSWGYVRNVEGFLLDKPNNIFEFGDPAFALNSFVTVRDMGRDASPAPTTVTWQGSVAATLTALQASAPAQGSCVVAPSIACVKWWTVPVGPLTADIEGEVGSGYVNKIASIASAIVEETSPLRGPELVAGSEFDSAGAWSPNSADISGGALTLLSLHLTQHVLSESVEVGEKFELTASVGGVPTGAVTVSLGDVFGGINTLSAYHTLVNGENKWIVTALANQSGDALVTVYNQGGSTAPPITHVGVRHVYDSIAPADVTAINTARPAVSGIHIGDENETIAQALDRLLIPANVLWGLNPDGTVRLAEVQLTTSAETLVAIDVERVDTYRPVWQVKLGYKKNHRVHSDGEISAALLLANVTGPAESTVFAYDYLGAANFGGTRDLTFKLLWGDGTVLTSGVSWQYRVLSGTVNGFTNASGWQSMSGTGIGIMTVSSLGADSSTIEVKALYGGEYRSLTPAPLTKQQAAPPSGGGGGPSTLASKSSGFASINSTTFTDTTGSLNGTTPAGVTSVTVAVNLSFTPVTSGGIASWTCEAKLQRKVAGVWTDVGATVSAGSDVYDLNAGDTPTLLRANAASFSFNRTDSGLTASTAYEWRIVGRLTSGTRTHNVTGTVSVTG